MMKKLYCLLLFYISCFTAGAQTYFTGHRTVNYYNATASRTVATELYYPADAAGMNVPLAAGSAKFPVVVFGHGFVLPVSSYTWLADSLVRAGFILAMPTTESGFSPSHSAFAGDLAFLCQRIMSLNDSTGNFLYGRVRNRSAVGGHSMGGGSSVLAAANSNDINALFNFAAAETNPSAISAASSVNKPSLVFSGSADCIVAPSVQQSIFNNIAYSCRSYINLTDALHCQFANNNGTCVFGQITTGCNSSSLTPADVYSKVCRVLIPFLESYLESSCLSAEYINAFNNLTGVTSVFSCTSEPGCSVVALAGISLQAARWNNTVRLTWKVPSVNGHHFEVEKSMDGSRFEKIATVSSEVNKKTYTYIDRDTPGRYYRIRQVSRNGLSVYSPVAVLKNITTPKGAMGFPNPFRDELSVFYQADHPGSILVTLYDLAGKRMVQKNMPAEPGSNFFSLNCGLLAKGVYLLNIRNGNSGVTSNEMVVKE